MHGTKIKSYREIKDYTQKDLSDLSNIPQTTISDWERGLCPSHLIQRAIQLASCLGTTVEDLFTPEITDVPK